MKSLLDDIQTSAKWIARARDNSGYKADFPRRASGTSNGSWPRTAAIGPIQRVIEQFHAGPEDSIAFYGAVLGPADTSADCRR
ncbi:hypothetical protein J7E87_17890 [Streptomyces sp. ISL-1]|uniref:hypothetical protein n=1 Tax=Streptomyces sp. ISL-1 TaxID=2817657 RepID=UPI001BE8A020|nr:hypothetical protein [Streptomyces sp. ISL-1]MBT2391249.1 hypothetical protein [Streptomyces sp. ISL-1]